MRTYERINDTDYVVRYQFATYRIRQTGKITYWGYRTELYDIPKMHSENISAMLRKLDKYYVAELGRGAKSQHYGLIFRIGESGLVERFVSKL